MRETNSKSDEENGADPLDVDFTEMVKFSHPWIYYYSRGENLLRKALNVDVGGDIVGTASAAFNFF